MINVFGSKVGKEEIKQVSESITNQWMGIGPKVKQFEAEFQSRLGLPNFLLLDNGSNALYLACTILNLPPGSEIIVPTFTWVSCAQAVILAGHTPVLCDVDINTMNVTRETIEPTITDKTAAIMIVHYAGLPVDMEPIIDLGYPIIEDAAHAVDSYHKGKACGEIADVGIYSFDAVKNLAIGEGGGITSNNQERFDHAKILRYCGIGKSGFEASKHGKKRWWEYNIVSQFIKMTPTDISAGIGLAQLEKLNDMQSYRKKIWNIYQEEFKNCNWIINPVNENAGDQHSYFTYAIRVPKRDELAHYLFDKGIYTTLRYHPLHMNKLYKQTHINLSNAERLNKEALSVPIHPNLTMKEVEYIVNTIKSFKR